MFKKEKLSEFRRLFVEFIYEATEFEGLHLTYAQTYEIVNFMNKIKDKYSWKEIEVVKGLKKAYDYVETIVSTNKQIGILEFLTMNALIDGYEEDNAGKWRENKVRIGGTDYTPPIYKPLEWHKKIEELLKAPIKSIQDGIKLFAILSKMQCFNNGNKRTAICLCNALLIQNNLDLIHIKNHMQFIRKLVDYYEDGDAKLDEFINYVAETSLNKK